MTKKKTTGHHLCRYCKCDISYLHHNAVHCKKPICSEEYEYDRVIKVKKGSEQWRERKKKRVKKSGNRLCRACRSPLPKGRWFFCDDFCQALIKNRQRIDGEWLYF